MPFVTQYQPSLSTITEALMKKRNLIQDQPLLHQIFKEPPIISYKKGKSSKDMLRISRRYRSVTCDPLHFLALTYYIYILV